MIHLHTKYEVSMFTHYTKILKEMQNVEIGVAWELGVTHGH